MSKIVVDIADCGSVETLHDDRFPLHEIGAGSVQMQRASLIEWDEMDQHWNVRLPGYRLPFTETKNFKSYEQARAFEVEWLNTCRFEKVEPSSPEGLAIAKAIRNG